MIAAGMGVGFMPEYSATHPGIVTRPIDPEVAREVSLVAVANGVLSPPTAAFVEAERSDDETLANGVEYDLGGVVETELLHEIRAVGFHR